MNGVSRSSETEVRKTRSCDELGRSPRIEEASLGVPHGNGGLESLQSRSKVRSSGEEVSLSRHEPGPDNAALQPRRLSIAPAAVGCKPMLDRSAQPTSERHRLRNQPVH